jgi:hypothetical protein
MTFSIETYSKRFEKKNDEVRAYYLEKLETDRNLGIKIDELVDIVHDEHPDWSLTKIAQYICAENEDLDGFSSKTIYDKISDEKRILYGRSEMIRSNNNNKTKLQNKVRKSDVETFPHRVLEDSSRMDAREFTKQQYQIAHRNMSKSEVDKLFEEIPQNLDFDNITVTDLNSALTNANESVIKKDLEEAETRLKRFDILMKAAATTKDQKVDKKKPEPKPKNKNIVSKKYELKYKDQFIPLICLFYYDTESFTITVDE